MDGFGRCVAITAGAQSYNTAFGFRFGDDLGFSFTQRVLDHTTIDLNASDGLFSQHKFVSLQIRSNYGVITRRFNFFWEEVASFAPANWGLMRYLMLPTSKAFQVLWGLNLHSAGSMFLLDYMPQYILNKDYTGQKVDCRFCAFHKICVVETQDKKFENSSKKSSNCSA